IRLHNAWRPTKLGCLSNDETLKRSLEHCGDNAIVIGVAGLHMPRVEASEQTNAAYHIGARIIMTHLIEADWDLAIDSDGMYIKEFLCRVMQNAARQAIDLPDQP